MSSLSYYIEKKLMKESVEDKIKHGRPMVDLIILNFQKNVSVSKAVIKDKIKNQLFKNLVVFLLENQDFQIE